MKADRETKRLFVGGLGQAISETDLKNQFSRFGEVSDVEIITRKDDQGNPQKIFAYVNIKVAEADLKKCMSVLNKTKWKGGTLQIQLAKESFLHRLAQEREEAKAKKEKSRTNNTNVLEKMGGIDFQMKAVPGTEVPGHKNWVVSKFGRVLPVLHLKNQHKRKIMKYDPSKYCHNLKKIGEDFTNTVPITNLTWELEGGNDPMSKKRRGEFSDFHGPKKMKKVQKGKGSTVSPRTGRVMESSTSTQPGAAQKMPCASLIPESSPVPDSGSQKLQSVPFQISGLETARKRNSMSDDDIDSEDELRMLIAKEENLQRTTWSSINESENDPFEVVRDDFKSDVHKLHSGTGLGINNISCCVSDSIMGGDHEYDSGDTDEIIAMKQNISKAKNRAEISQTEKPMHNKTFKKKEVSNHCNKIQKREIKKHLALSNGVKPASYKSSSDSSSSDDEDSEGDEEYKAFMKNCPHVNLTLADLEQLAGSDLVGLEDSDTNGPETTTRCKFDRVSKSPKTPRAGRSRQCIHPEEIVASLLEEENTWGKQKPKENNLKPKFQAFKGVGCLYAKESVKKRESVDSNNINEYQSSLKLEDTCSISIENESLYVNGSSSNLTSRQRGKTINSPNHTPPQKRQFTFETQDHKVVSPSSSKQGGSNSVSSSLPLKGKKSLNLSATTHKIGIDKDSCHSAKKTEAASEEEGSDSSSLLSLEKLPEISPRKDAQEGTADFSHSISSSTNVSAKDKYAKDNQKRLAALEARQKAKEVKKKLVHDALANLDAHPEDKPTHIIFGSDSEDETEETCTQEQSRPGKELVKESVGKASGQLFGSSDEELDSEDDIDRFKIKPQFEGRAGQKLLDLQSHFGSDDRFRLDSRFLESDSEEEQEEINEKKTAEEEEFAAEKKKALNVVQSVLHITLNNSANKGSVAAKKFKDIIRYDPTRHDHATYERKKDDKPKESKAKRKKKREEAEKLPEVSKEMYYNIATNLKEIFQTTKDTNEKEERTAWNEDCGGDETEEIHHAAALTSGTEQSSGFMFSFFDSDTKDVKEETYKVEAVKPGKIVWKGNPHFQESSSEEEDVTEETDHRKSSPGEASVPEKETTRFFFFSKNDERLHGSDMFWSGVGSNISRNSWEARTNSLRMDCRKKHKEAKRKVKSK